ncbi:MAG: ABC-2 family transporter protein [Polyangiales bacterium]
MRRYARLLAVQLRASMLLALQYRADFVIDGVLEIFFAMTAIVPLLVVFRTRASVAGWSFGEALIVIGWFHTLLGIIEGAINPSLTGVVEHVRKGTLDFLLLKPADAQFLVSTARFQVWRATHFVTSLVIFTIGFRMIGRAPSALAIMTSLAMLAIAVVILYSLWILTVSAAFYVVRVDNLTFLFDSIFDAARWPASVFRGAVRFAITFVIPLAVMTTFPAQALLGTLPVRALIASSVGAVVFAVVSRVVWSRAIARYTSAGG